MLKKLCFAAAFTAALGACSYVDEYERQVSDWEPTYCYKSLSDVQCYREPKQSDALRLVNYYGPHPSRYEAPEKAPAPAPKAPEMVNYWVKDPEPVPRAAPSGDLGDRPWLTAEGQAEQAALEAAHKAKKEDAALMADSAGTRALLRRIADGAAGLSAPVDLPAPDADVK